MKKNRETLRLLCLRLAELIATPCYAHDIVGIENKYGIVTCNCDMKEINIKNHEELIYTILKKDYGVNCE